MGKNILAPAEIAGAAIEAGRAKAERKLLPMFVLAILAGAFIAFAAETSNMAAFNLLGSAGTYGLGRALAGAIFAGGLILVILTGAELFTGNTLICLSVYEKKVSPVKMLRNWAVVYAGNLAGAVLIAFMVSQTGLLGSSEGMLGAITVKIAYNKVSMSFWSAFVSGILCNWLVCLGVWIAFAANSVQGKIMGIFFPIWFFVTSGFEHCVANMYYIPAGILAMAKYGSITGIDQAALTAGLNWGSFFTANLIPVTLGNIIGGVVFVGSAYWFALYRPSKDN